MAVSERIKAEARRTISGMQKFYEKYSDDVDDAEELEHRVARVEAAMEGCNGLSQEEKIQKTAENLFELTCSQERTYDAVRRELKIMRDLYRDEISKVGERFSSELKDLHNSLQGEIKSVIDKIGDSGSDGMPQLIPFNGHIKENVPDRKNEKFQFLAKIVSEHPEFTFFTLIVVLVLAFVSGHIDELLGLLGGN